MTRTHPHLINSAHQVPGSEKKCGCECGFGVVVLGTLCAGSAYQRTTSEVALKWGAKYAWRVVAALKMRWYADQRSTSALMLLFLAF